MPKLIIDENLCIRCHTCADGCVLGIIERSTDSTFPHHLAEMEELCLKCGHCEAFCPRGALVLDFLREEKIPPRPLDGKLTPDQLVPYLKKRRSVRQFTPDALPRGIVAGLLDAARYAASGGNQQPVQWLVVSGAAEVHKLAGLTIDWMRTLPGTDHPLAPYISFIVAKWDAGEDPICYRAPHLLFAHVPHFDTADGATEAVIAMTHVDLAAPAFGVGACWAGFVKMAVDAYAPLQAALALPEDRRIGCAMILGFPLHPVVCIPRRNPASITWR
jgi:nitroreductase/NAD-dependent dihydropyrimidine dehydrogenase PreA subunit